MKIYYIRDIVLFDSLPLIKDKIKSIESEEREYEDLDIIDTSIRYLILELWEYEGEGKIYNIGTLRDIFQVAPSPILKQKTLILGSFMERIGKLLVKIGNSSLTSPSGKNLELQDLVDWSDGLIKWRRHKR